MLTYPNIDPVALQLGPLAIRWYGLSYVVGIVLAWWLLRGRTRRPDIPFSRDDLADLVFFAGVGLVLGGRLGYVLFYALPANLAEPLRILRIWEGGMSFHGGLLGFVLGTWWWARRAGHRLLTVTDFAAPAVPVGLFCGRIANFINGELWGKPTDLPWAMVFPGAGGGPRHPSQLYEAALEGIVLFVILWVYSRRPRATGAVSGLFLIGYGFFRSLVEFAREPDAHLGYLAFGWLTMGQVLCAPMIALGGYLVWRARAEESRSPRPVSGRLEHDPDQKHAGKPSEKARV